MFYFKPGFDVKKNYYLVFSEKVKYNDRKKKVIGNTRSIEKITNVTMEIKVFFLKYPCEIYDFSLRNFVNFY